MLASVPPRQLTFRPQLQWVYAPGASTIMALEESLRQIEQWYFLPDPAEVKRFIRQRPALAPLLVEAIAVLYKYFGPGPYVRLRVVTDPEAEDCEELFAYIRVALPPDEALERLNRLDDEWFLDQLGRANGKFNFNLEFV